MSSRVTILKTRHGKPEPIVLADLSRAATALPHVDVAETGDRLRILQSGTELFTLYWEEGEAWTADPDESALELMIDIADRMGARVRSDEFETYRAANDRYFHPDDERAFARVRLEVETLSRETQRRSLILNASLFVMLVLAVLLANSCAGG